MALVVSLSHIGELCKVTFIKSLQSSPLPNGGISDRTGGSSCEWGLKSLILRQVPDLLERKCKPLQKSWTPKSLLIFRRKGPTLFSESLPEHI